MTPGPLAVQRPPTQQRCYFYATPDAPECVGSPAAERRSGLELRQKARDCFVVATALLGRGKAASAHSQRRTWLVLRRLGRNWRLGGPSRQHPVDPLAHRLEGDPPAKERNALDLAVNRKLDQVGVLAIVGLDDHDLAVARSDGRKL